eukprot:TRINITY_DN1216_c1_g1_i1.p1 TRINITY_DN1216_c1_g1~~TRINITY_DN1216_c1_g1_i1.p1  ORF type:complete len:245 (-),score=29.34 TRINITY_DN1216_c1_g1_i1:111-845(-)
MRTPDLAVDVDRCRVLSFDFNTSMLLSTGFEGALRASITLDMCPMHLCVNRGAGTYVLVFGSDSGYEVRVLADDLQLIDRRQFRLDLSVITFAMDSTGRLFALAAESRQIVGIFAVDVATGRVTTVLEPTPLWGDKPKGLLIDPRDNVVVWDASGQIITYDDQGEWLSCFSCGDHPTDVVVSADGIFAVNFLTVHDPSTIKFVSGDGRLLRCDRRLRFGGFVDWTDDYLLVKKWQHVGHMFCLR